MQSCHREERTGGLAGAGGSRHRLFPLADHVFVADAQLDGVPLRDEALDGCSRVLRFPRGGVLRRERGEAGRGFLVPRVLDGGVFRFLGLQDRDLAELLQGLGGVFRRGGRVFVGFDGLVGLAPPQERVPDAHLGLAVAGRAGLDLAEILHDLLEFRVDRQLGTEPEQEVHVRPDRAGRDRLYVIVVEQVAFGEAVIAPVMGDLGQHETGAGDQFLVVFHDFEPSVRLLVETRIEFEDGQLDGRIVVAPLHGGRHGTVQFLVLGRHVHEIADDAPVPVLGLLAHALFHVVGREDVVCRNVYAGAVAPAVPGDLFTYGEELCFRTGALFHQRLHLEEQQVADVLGVGMFFREGFGQAQAFGFITRAVGKACEPVLRHGTVASGRQGLLCRQEGSLGFIELAELVQAFPEHEVLFAGLSLWKGLDFLLQHGDGVTPELALDQLVGGDFESPRFLGRSSGYGGAGCKGKKEKKFRPHVRTVSRLPGEEQSSLVDILLARVMPR